MRFGHLPEDGLVSYEQVLTYGYRWPVTVLPTDAFMRVRTSFMPQLALIVGTLSAMLGTLLFFLVTRHLQDTRDLRRNHMALAESENLFRLAMRNAPIGMALVSLEGKWVAANPALCGILGYSEPELLLTDFQTITHPDDLEIDLAQVQRLIDGEADHYTLPKRYFHKNGAIVWIMLSVALLRKPSGDPDCFIAQIQNITQARQQEEERTQLIESLSESNADLERFAFIASHDLQEPLRMVCNFTGLLKQEYEDKLDDTAKSYIEIATSAATRMRTLIADLLDYARANHGGANRAGPFLAEEVLDHVRQNLASGTAESGASLDIGMMPPLWGDKVQFAALMQNLIGNALKYAKDDVTPVIEVKAAASGNNWEFSVADNGIGMKQEHLAQIFEPFKRLHGREKYSGTGMGLAICSKIVGKVGGRIWVTSTPSVGSTFHFTWPKAPA